MWVFACELCYDQNHLVINSLQTMADYWSYHNESTVDPDDMWWTACPHKCSGVCGNPRCDKDCTYRCNHTWRCNSKVSNVCWCGEIKEKDQTDIQPSERSPLPWSSLTKMEHEVNFRTCLRFGTVPLLHFCSYCNQDADDPAPLSGPRARTRQTR